MGELEIIFPWPCFDVEPSLGKTLQRFWMVVAIFMLYVSHLNEELYMRTSKNVDIFKKLKYLEFFLYSVIVYGKKYHKI